MANTDMELKTDSESTIQYELLKYKSNVVTKANNFVELPYKLTPIEHKIINFMISLVQPNDDNFLLYRFKAVDLVNYLQINTKNYAEIGRIIRKLKKRSLIIQKEDSILDVNWLASAEYYRGGVIELEISQKLAPFFLQLKKNFTTYKIHNIVPLKSCYSIRLYEIFKMYETQQSFNKIKEKTYSIDELKKILGIEKEYKLYGHFNEKVLNVAESELKEKCDIFFTYIPLKNGKKVEKIKFTIHKNIKNAKISETDVNELQKPIYDRILSDLKVAEAILQGIFQKYPLEKIETAYLETLERSKVSKVENTAGYFISLVKDPEYGLAKKEEKEKREIQKKVLEQEDIESDVQSTKLLVSKRMIESWKVANPDKFEQIRQEELLKLEGNSMTEKNRQSGAIFAANARVKQEYLHTITSNSM